MPYCPVCRGEYREGHTRCTKCDADLVAELPPAPPGPLVWESIPAPLQRFALSWVGAWRIVVAVSARGWEVFRGSRTLVWLVVAAVLLSTALTLAGSVITFTSTEAGRGIVSQFDGWLATELLGERPHVRFPWLRLRFSLATQQFGGEVAGLSLTGALQPVSVLLLPSGEHADTAGELVREQLRVLPYVAVASVLEILALAYWTATILAALKRRVTDNAGSTDEAFLRAGARYWRRLAALAIAAWAVVFVTISLPFAVIFPLGTSTRFVISLLRIVPIIVGIATAFAPTIILLDDVGAWTAVRRNVRFLIGHWQEAVLFLLLLSVLRWVLLLPAAVASAFDTLYTVPITRLTFGAVPFSLLRGLAHGVLSLWFAATAMVWYSGGRRVRDEGRPGDPPVCVAS